jgi:ubiquinone/menaquinone biosynthesis C-methylase UbiE
MPIARVRDAYSERADEYVDILGSTDSVHTADRELVSTWSQGIDGPVVDAGCGPGQWTSFLHERGAEIEGIDLVPQFIVRAKERFPDVPFRVGRLEALNVPDGSLAGVLSWYSIIHMVPAEVGAALREFARCLEPGGSLLLGFFEGPVVESFAHAVVTAYRWPVDEMRRELGAAGFETIETYTRTGPGYRPHAAIVALRTPAAG